MPSNISIKVINTTNGTHQKITEGFFVYSKMIYRKSSGNRERVIAFAMVVQEVILVGDNPITHLRK
jgi:hypothetical protein